MSLTQINFSSQLSSLASDLHANGIREVFGVVGDPVTPLVEFAEKLDMRYFGFRNEQAASYAASIVSFLTSQSPQVPRLGVVLTVAGPGFTNALTGLANATINGWPVLLVCPLTVELGAFQALDQISCLPGLVKGHVLYEGHSDSVKEAIELAYTNRGAVVLFVPHNKNALRPKRVRQKGKNSAKTSLKAIKSSRPLLIIGGRAPLELPREDSLLNLVNKYQIPFLAEPMGRGIISESHALCVTAAKGQAMQSCSLAIIVGGKLDWMVGFGEAPKWSKDCAFVSVESLDELDLTETAVDANWLKSLQNKTRENKANLKQKLTFSNSSSILTHWEAIGVIKFVINENNLNDCIVVSEGANTMDVARVALDDIKHPCRRLDAGRWGTMGSGLGFTLAASQISLDDSCVITIQGDSAFGFSGMELETLVRYKCKALIIIFNNGGIYTGVRSNATAFSPSVRHDLLMTALGGYGLTTVDRSLYETLNLALSYIQEGKYPVLVDVLIDPTSGTVSGSLSRL